MNVLVFGASNADRWFKMGAAGETAFQAVFAGRDLNLINAAVSNTSSGDWLSTEAGNPYANLRGMIEGLQIDAAIFIIGGGDAIRGVTAEQYRDNLAAIFSQLRSDTGADALPIFMQRLFAPLDGLFEPDQIRAGEEMAAALDQNLTLIDHEQLIELGGDLTHVDAQHYTQATYSVMADDIARAVLEQLTGESAAPLTAGTTLADVLDGTAQADRVYGFGGSDTLTGGGQADVLIGGLGRDVLLGGANADLLGGGCGADILKGMAGDDFLWGEDGRDTLIGAAGRDTMSGGMGDDIFVVRGAGVDKILDYQPGDVIAVDQRTRYHDGRLYSGGDLIARVAGSPEEVSILLLS